MNQEQALEPGSESRISPARRSKAQNLLRELWKAPITAKFGILVVSVYGFVALFAPFLTPYGEAEIVGPEFALWESHSFSAPTVWAAICSPDSCLVRATPWALHL